MPVFAATAIGKIVISGLISLAVNVALYVLTPKPKRYGARDRGIAETVRSAVSPWQIILGKTRVGGTIVFAHEHKTGNILFPGETYLHMVVVLAGHECEAVDQVRVDDQVIPLDGSGEGTGEWEGAIRVLYRLGDHTETWEELIDETPFILDPLETKWTSAHRLLGKCSAFVRITKGHEKWAGGVGNLSFVVRGYNGIRDPRGPSVGYSTNAALCQAAFIENAAWGLGDVVDDDALIADANICDEAVSLDAGGTEPRYECNGTFTSDQDPQKILSGLLSASGGRAVRTSGKWYTFAAAWRGASVELTDDDVRGDIKVPVRVSRREIGNAVKGVLQSPLHRYLPTEYPPVTSATHLAEDDGTELWLQLDLPFTQSAATAQRLAKIELLRSRRQISVELPAGLGAYRVGVPDTIQFTHERFGWSAKTFEVEDAVLNVGSDPQGVPLIETMLRMRETDAGVYDWTATEENEFLASPTTDLENPLEVDAPTDLVLTADGTTRREIQDGVLQPRIVVEWTPPDDDRVIRYQVEHKVASESDWDSGPVVPVGTHRVELGPVTAEETYDVRVRSVNRFGAVSAWLADDVVVATSLSVIRARIDRSARIVRPGSIGDAAIVRGVVRGTAKDGDSVVFPVMFEDAPLVRVVPRKIKTTGSGLSGIQAIRLEATNVTVNGFDVVARVEELVGSTTPLSATFSGSPSVAIKTETPEAFDDNYVVAFDVSLTKNTSAVAEIQVGIYTRPSGGGAWTLRAQRFHEHTDVGTLNIADSVSINVDGLGADAEFKVERISWVGASFVDGDDVTWFTATAPAGVSATDGDDLSVEWEAMEVG